MKKILVFRLDDVCPMMDAEKFERVINIFEEYNVKPLLGIVPDNKDTNLNKDEENAYFWSKMRELVERNYDIAMHGYQHIYDNNKMGIVNTRKASEFAGHSYEVQVEKIRKGKEMLQEKIGEVDIFFAPGHSYDKCTIDALHENGFKWMSDGRSHWGYQNRKIKFIPCRAYGLSVKNNRINTICIHANNLNNEVENRLRKIIEENREYIYSFKDVRNQFSALSRNDMIMRLDERIYVFYERYIRKKISPYYQAIKNRLKKYRGN